MISSAPSSLPPSAGDAAPDFTLPSTGGEKVTLSSFRGKKNVLLAFFPAAFTSVCTAELCDFSAGYDAFTGKDTEVFPLSVDLVPSLKEFKRKYDMKVTLLSDARRDVSRAYGVLDAERFQSERAYFLVGKDGRIAWRHVERHGGEKRTNDEVLAEIAKLG